MYRKTITLIIILLLVLKFDFLFAQDKQVEKFYHDIKKNNVNVLKRTLKTNPSLLDSTFSEKMFFRGIIKYPIHQALIYSSKTTIDLLLSYGADMGKEMRETGLMSGKNVSCLEIIVVYRDIDMLKYYFDKMTHSPRDFCNALFEASDSNKSEMVLFLLSKGEGILLKNK